MQSGWTTGTWLSSKSTQWELSNEYQHGRVDMVFKIVCVLVLWTKVAPALEGLKCQFQVHVYNWTFSPQYKSDIMPYFNEVNTCFGCNLSLLWSPLINRTRTIANFGHTDFKSWLIPWTRLGVHRCDVRLTHSCLISLTYVVCTFNTYGYNFRINHNFTNYLKENWGLGSDEHYSFK